MTSSKLVKGLSKIVSGFQIHTITTIDKFEFDPGVRKDAEHFLKQGGSLEDAKEMFAGEDGYLGQEVHEQNVFLNEGLNRIWELVTGGSTVHFDNATATCGVGNSATAAGPTDTGLIGASFDCDPMDGSYPLGAGSGQNVDFRATFTSAEANFVWAEFTVADGAACDDAGGAINLHRTVSAQGTKTSGQTWILTITLSAT